MSADPTAAVVAALVDGPDPQKTVSELVETTSLCRGDVASALASLAAAERVTGALADVDGALSDGRCGDE